MKPFLFLLTANIKNRDHHHLHRPAEREERKDRKKRREMKKKKKKKNQGGDQELKHQIGFVFLLSFSFPFVLIF